LLDRTWWITVQHALAEQLEAGLPVVE